MTRDERRESDTRGALARELLVAMALGGCSEDCDALDPISAARVAGDAFTLADAFLAAAAPAQPVGETVLTHEYDEGGRCKHCGSDDDVGVAPCPDRVAIANDCKCGHGETVHRQGLYQCGATECACFGFRVGEPVEPAPAALTAQETALVLAALPTAQWVAWCHDGKAFAYEMRDEPKRNDRGWLENYGGSALGIFALDNPARAGQCVRVVREAQPVASAGPYRVDTCGAASWGAYAGNRCVSGGVSLIAAETWVRELRAAHAAGRASIDCEAARKLAQRCEDAAAGNGPACNANASVLREAAAMLREIAGAAK